MKTIYPPGYHHNGFVAIKQINGVITPRVLKKLSRQIKIFINSFIRLTENLKCTITKSKIINFFLVIHTH